jgi:hypothetical protein
MAEKLIDKIAAFLPNQITPKAATLVAPKKLIGRPPGSKTRLDAPSKLAAAARNSQTPFQPQTQTQIPPVSGASRPDTDLFGNEKPSPGETPPDGEKSFFPPDEEINVKKDESEPEDHRPVATMIWDTIIGLFTAIIGAFWLPRKMGKNIEAGEIPYDEREMVISAFCQYFASIGMAVLSPLQMLYMAIFTYCVPRLKMTFDWIKLRFMKKAKPAATQPEKDNRMPQTETPPNPDPTEETAKKETPPFTPGQLDVLQ